MLAKETVTIIKDYGLEVLRPTLRLWFIIPLGVLIAFFAINMGAAFLDDHGLLRVSLLSVIVMFILMQYFINFCMVMVYAHIIAPIGKVHRRVRVTEQGAKKLRHDVLATFGEGREQAAVALARKLRRWGCRYAAWRMCRSRRGKPRAGIRG